MCLATEGDSFLIGWLNALCAGFSIMENRRARHFGNLAKLPIEKHRFAVDMQYVVAPRLSDISSYLFSLNASVMLITPNEKTPEIYEVLMRQSAFEEQNVYNALQNGTNSLWGEPGWHMPTGLMNGNFYAYRTIPFYQRVLRGVTEFIGVIKCSVWMDRLFSVLYTYEGSEPMMVCRIGR